MARTMVLGGVLVAVSITLGCAARQPVVYVDARQSSRSGAAIADCQERARTAGADRVIPGRLVRGTAQRSKATVPLGAVAGALGGGRAKGAAVGAAAGVVVALAGSSIDSLENDSLYVSYMQLCLEEQGFRLIGWR